MSSKPLQPGKRPMKAKVNQVHINYYHPRPQQAQREKCNSCILIAAAVSVGIIMAIVAILLS